MRRFGFSAAVVLMLLPVGSVAIGAEGGHNSFIHALPTRSIGTVNGETAEIWSLIDGVILSDGRAAGILQLRIDTGETLICPMIEGRLALDGDVVLEADITVMCVGSDGAPTGDTDVLRLQPVGCCGNEELIYDLLGANVHGSVEGTIEVFVRK